MTTSPVRVQNNHSLGNGDVFYDMSSPLQYVLRSIPVVDFVVNFMQQSQLAKEAAHYRPPAGVLAESLKMNAPLNKLIQVQRIQAVTSLIKAIVFISLCILFPANPFVGLFAGLYLGSVWNNNKCVFENKETIRKHQNYLDTYFLVPSFLNRPFMYSFL